MFFDELPAGDPVAVANGIVVAVLAAIAPGVYFYDKKPKADEKRKRGGRK